MRARIDPGSLWQEFLLLLAVIAVIGNAGIARQFAGLDGEIAVDGLVASAIN